MKVRRFTRGLLPVLLLLGACSSKVSNLYSDPSFGVEGLREDGVAVFGVAALAGPDDLDTRIAHRTVVAMTLRGERPDLRWIDAEQTWIALGPETALEILDSYRQTGRVGPNELRELSVLTDRLRYLVFARVDLDMTSLDYERRDREVAGRKIAEIEPKSRREMSVGFDVLDLVEGRLVWSAVLQRTMQERGRSIDVEPVEENPSEGEIVRAIRERLRDAEFPAPPSRGRLLSEMSAEVAEDWPGRAKGR